MKRSLPVLGLVVVVASGASCAQGAGSNSCVVSAGPGTVHGVDFGASCVFLGVPYAAAPIGRLRWAPPAPPAAWEPATLTATSPPPPCPQIAFESNETVGSEDCLKLNIWTPNPRPTAPAPVIVWLHAGAFVAGSANMPQHDGRRYAEQTGAIVVAPNYRLGPLGFLAHPALTAENASYRSSGNYGLLDQRTALAWVRNHIAAFGGNPDAITLAGQSAGAHSVGLHLVSPSSTRLFHRAIMQSGFASTLWRTLSDAEVQGNNLADFVGCADDVKVLECLRAKSADAILRALPSGRQQFAETARAAWSPVVDGVEIPDQPRALFERSAFSRVPVVLGATRDEGWEYVNRSFPAGLSAEVYEAAVETEFGTPNTPAILARYPVEKFPSPKHALAKLTGDTETVCEATRVGALIERTGTPVYVYSFERQVDGLAAHGDDTHFVFGSAFNDSRSNHALNHADLDLFRAISSYWMRFAATGDPNSLEGRAPAWPPFSRADQESSDDERYLVLDWPIREGRQLGAGACRLWESFFLRSVVGSVPASLQP